MAVLKTFHPDLVSYCAKDPMVKTNLARSPRSYGCPNASRPLAQGDGDRAGTDDGLDIMAALYSIANYGVPHCCRAIPTTASHSEECGGKGTRPIGCSRTLRLPPGA